MRVRLFALFGLAFVVAYGSADLLTSLHSWRWPMAPTPWPFWPEWSLVYISLDLLLPLAFWRVPAQRLGSFTAALLLATLVAWPLFLLFPLAAMEAAMDTNPAFQLADALNLDANFFPSLHVTYALLAAAFLARPWAWLWGAAIAFSTLPTHQHYTIDVVAGAALAAACYQWVRTFGRLDALCLQEVARCAARHRRYAVIGAGLLLASIPHWRRRRLARIGFCYLQHLDDLLDGHLRGAAEPEEIASAHQRALLGTESFDDTPLGELGAAFREELSRRDNEGIATAVAVIQEMKLDRRRVRERLLLDENELDAHLERTFELSLDLMLLAADSPLRAARTPHLVKALGWCSIVRDWQEDQALGLINVPGQVWRKQALDPWFQRRHAEVLQDLAASAEELKGLADQKGARLLGLFHRSVVRYARREGADRAPGKR